MRKELTATAGRLRQGCKLRQTGKHANFLADLHPSHPTKHARVNTMDGNLGKHVNVLIGPFHPTKHAPVNTKDENLGKHGNVLIG